MGAQSTQVPHGPGQAAELHRQRIEARLRKKGGRERWGPRLPTPSALARLPTTSVPRVPAPFLRRRQWAALPLPAPPRDSPGHMSSSESRTGVLLVQHTSAHHKPRHFNPKLIQLGRTVYIDGEKGPQTPVKRLRGRHAEFKGESSEPARVQEDNAARSLGEPGAQLQGAQTPGQGALSKLWPHCRLLPEPGIGEERTPSLQRAPPMPAGQAPGVAGWAPHDSPLPASQGPQGQPPRQQSSNLRKQTHLEAPPGDSLPAGKRAGCPEDPHFCQVPRSC